MLASIGVQNGRINVYLGHQLPARSDTDYEVYAQLGINHICGWPEPPWVSEWDAAYLSSFREKIESFGLTLDMIGLPINTVMTHEYFAAGRPTDGSGLGPAPHIMLGKSPERDREIDRVCENIRACSEAGIPAAKYNLTFLPVMRTERTEGRGGSSNSTFRFAEADQNPPLTIAGHVSEDEYWERIDYFLERVVPVAAECKVRIACHPHDPPTPPGYLGITRVFGTVEGYKKFVMMHESPYHGVNFCQGTVCEMLEDPGKEIYDVIRWFGERKKIFNVHFRNIRGKRYDFVEVFPDEGDVDMLKAAQVYKDVDYLYMIMPDHVPWISGENRQGVGFAFAAGYIQALLQAVNAGD